MAPVGIVALSYGKRAPRYEPNPVNRKLGDQVIRLIDEYWSNTEARKLDPRPVVTVAQWEIAKRVERESHLFWRSPFPLDRVVNLKEDGSYLDSKDVLEAAFEEFRAAGVKQVIVVANPFLHLGHVRKMVEAAGFEVLRVEIKPVGFDNSPDQLQWWCKGPVRSIFYAGLQVIGKLTSINFHGIGEKAPA